MQVNAISSNTNTNIASTSSRAVNGDGSFESYLGETKELDTIFQKAAKKYGVDVNLLKSVARVESNFHADAVSSAGAVGIMQLMPNTAKGLGVKDSYDAEQNIMGGAKLLSNLMKKYDGDLELTLAGYNAGTGNVQKYGGVPPWKSVHNYINKVLGYYKESGGTTVSNQTTATSSEFEIADNMGDAPAFGESFYKAVNTSSTDQITAMLDTLNRSSKETGTGLNDALSYENYLKFVDLYVRQQEEEKSEDK